MESYSYILSTTVSTELQNIEQTRKKILLELISEKMEAELRFENLITIISSSLLISGRSLSANEIVSVLRRRDKNEKYSDVTSIKNAYDYMRHYCHLTGLPVNKELLSDLLRILIPGRKIDGQRIATILEFINVSSEHPIVQSALCFALLLDLLPEDNNNIKIASIASQVFNYNYGYDLRGMINLQEFFFSDFINLKQKLKKGAEQKNLTDFIEYYVQAFSIQAEKGYRILNTKMPTKAIPEIFKKLSERQVRILGLFTIPEVKISNKVVQKEFGVSQITASRDLSQLASLGLIFQKGRGRSVYYVKM